LRLERLKWTVVHAYENIRFYREAMIYLKTKSGYLLALTLT
jgi:phenylacetate-coenzyme A ligase PaaK-like adenylate-forming protein